MERFPEELGKGTRSRAIYDQSSNFPETGYRCRLGVYYIVLVGYLLLTQETFTDNMVDNSGLHLINGMASLNIAKHY